MSESIKDNMKWRPKMETICIGKDLTMVQNLMLLGDTLNTIGSMVRDESNLTSKNQPL